MVIYKITEILGIIPLLIALIYIIIGIKQSIKRKSILKVDKEIYLLGFFYLFVIIVYIFFEKFVINYRPVLINNILEPSYPSSHTLMSICICISSIIINKKIFRNNLADIENIISIIVMALIIVGRIISGVHWFTDILGGIIISSTLVVLFYTVLNSIKPKIEKIEF